MNGIKFIPTLKNTIKCFSLGSFIYPLLFSIFIWFALGFTIEPKYFLIVVSVFIISYVSTSFLFVLKGLHKRIYYFLLLISVLLILIQFIPAIDRAGLSKESQSIINSINIILGKIQQITSFFYISCFVVSHNIFFYSYNSVFPIGRRIKIQQKINFFKQKIGISISNLKISLYGLLIPNILALIILSILEYVGVFNFNISRDAIAQINVTVFALILPLSLAIVTSNEYSKISRYYTELFQGWNLLFFLSYILVIFLSISYQNGFVSILSITMIINTFVFILNLAKQTSTEQIVGRLFNKLENEINNGNYRFIKSTKSKINWNAVTGLKVTTKIVDKNKEFESTIDLLNQLAAKALQNKDRDTFTTILRGYLNLSRFFLITIKTDKDKVANLLSQIYTQSINAKQDDEFLKILLQEMVYDYSLSESFIDIKIWNLQRFNLMKGIAENNKERKEVFTYIVSLLIKMVIIKMMEGKFGPQITYNSFSNNSYIQFKNTEEYKELEKLIENNKKKISCERIRNDLDMHKYGNKLETDFFEESKRNILKELKLSFKKID